ncbi:cytoplasmic tRNA 2-thiolation protein 2-like [Phragmites australis]|uniref:cytoplasmic tRNA 2-thiolation protein 2-like n=1 Tax=Phragmites australis TaxID=29695 RepID=UPI002D775823|nr:cytoplasmic tRNA 2-thiolation protein 2-like [Phragmites australis]
MAAATSCGGAGCGPHCSSSSSAGAEDDAPSERMGQLSFSSAAAATCGKCDSGGAAAAVAGGVGMCGGCFRAHLFGKFKLAVTSNAMVRPTDAVLLAFSGGPASRVALQFIHEMQSKAIQSWETSNSQALPAFGLGVAFVDESSVLSLKPQWEIETAIEDIRAIVSSLSLGDKAVHIAPLEDVFSSGSEDGEGRLREVVGMIDDETGRDDFLRWLRMLLLQKIALENGYTKIMLGSCASGIACHVLSATVKGQGYSLPADVQYVDTRWEVPVVLPLHDCLAQELSLLCELDSLKTQQLLDRPCSGINSLVASFVSRLREENPSREHTILRTAQKLKPFSFNKFSANGYHDFLPSRLRSKFQNVDTNESTFSEILCLICGSPFSESELQNLESTKHKAQEKIDLYTAHCCQSCHFQILPAGTNMYEHFFSLLPKFWTEKVDTTSASHSSLRDQIEDYLLEEDDDEN